MSAETTARLFDAVPQEIVDEIIEHLHDDPHTLACCALVCISWTAASQRALFRVCELDIAAEDFQDKWSWLVDGPNAEAVRGYVRDLIIKPAEDDLDALPVVRLDNIAKITDAFPALRALTLEKVKVPGSHDLYAVRRSLERLTLSKVWVFATAHSFFEAVLRMYDIRELHISTICFSDAPSPEDTRTTPDNISGVETLVVRSAAFTGCIVDFFSQAPLRKLDVAYSTEVDIKALSSLLTGREISLEDMSVGLAKSIARMQFRPDEDVFPAMLRQCESLGTLTLRVTLGKPWDAGMRSLRALAQMVSGVSADLRALTIVVAVDNSANFETAFSHAFEAGLKDHLTGLDGIFIAKPELRTIRWLWSGARSRDGSIGEVIAALHKRLTRLVRAQFPTLHKKGILCFGEDNATK
ncbi:hypothetical protein PsYK624_137990 [Phanerochaete sordida]|uniref:F-box domain-containing protein n=1 Tax=Phanerochaete sordida TaxID=48140 RepID=A0A9P3GKI9_9APHY|nr:hypothetical protein PsYK624_137990 [Phanerochaete sordida]